MPQPPQPFEAVDRTVVRPQRHHLRVQPLGPIVARALLAAVLRAGCFEQLARDKMGRERAKEFFVRNEEMERWAMRRV